MPVTDTDRHLRIPTLGITLHRTTLTTHASHGVLRALLHDAGLARLDARSIHGCRYTRVHHAFRARIYST
jgi:hypothetical protein